MAWNDATTGKPAKSKVVTADDLQVLRENYQRANVLLASDKTLARLRREYEDAVLTFKAQKAGN